MVSPVLCHACLPPGVDGAKEDTVLDDGEILLGLWRAVGPDASRTELRLNPESIALLGQAQPEGFERGVGV